MSGSSGWRALRTGLDVAHRSNVAVREGHLPAGVGAGLTVLNGLVAGLDVIADFSTVLTSVLAVRSCWEERGSIPPPDGFIDTWDWKLVTVDGYATEVRLRFGQLERVSDVRRFRRASYGGYVMGSFRRTVEPILGTRLTMRIDAVDESSARRAEAAAVDEADRLEAMLSAYLPSSALTAWRQGNASDVPSDVVDVLSIAARWYERTQGAFNPYLDAVSQRWRRAELEQQLPGADELAALAAAARRPYRIEGGRVVVTADCEIVNVQGVAKGWVIDRMTAAATAIEGISGVIVDLGGDLRHLSHDATSVATIAIENPFDVVDNAAPLTTVRLANMAVATSSGGRRGWRIGGAWYGHVLDPATGWPLAAQRSATVVAATAADADAAASAAVVAGPDLFEQSSDLAVLVVDTTGGESRNAHWRESVLEVQ